MFICLALIVCATNAHANKNQRKQVRIKAAFIFQMAKFVNWQYNDNAHLTFCFHQDNRSFDVYGALKQLQTQGKLTLGNRQIQLTILNEDYKDIEQYQQCDLIYFIPRLDSKIPIAILKQLGQKKLIIGNSKAFLAKGGLSALIVEQGKNKLYINRVQYQQSEVKIRSRLMKLARMYPK